MKKYLILFEKPFMDYDRIINSSAFEFIRSDTVRGKQMGVFSFNDADIPLLRESLDFELIPLFYVFDRHCNAYELTKNGFGLSCTLKKKINLIKDYSRAIKRYEKSDRIRNNELKKYCACNHSAIVKNEPSLLFPAFRRCRYYCKSDTFCCRFRLHVPSEKAEEHPLIIFYDGSGSPGYDNTKQMFDLMHPWSRIKKLHRDCCIIAPQLDKTQSYNSNVFSDMMRELVNTVSDEVCTIDMSRIYLVGISYGGYGVIYEAFRHPDRYAAVVETVGWYYYNAMMIKWDSGAYSSDRYHHEFDDSGYRELAKTPFWFACSQLELEYTEALLKEINADVKFTRNDKHGHSMYKRFYKKEPWEEWLLEKRKKM